MSFLARTGRKLFALLAEDVTDVAEYTFSLTGQMPSGKNSVVVRRDGKRFPSRRFSLWRDAALAEVARHKVPLRPIEGPCHVTVWYTRGDDRRRDVPGMMDALCHLMERADIVRDDSLLVSWEWVPIEGDEPSVWVKIESGYDYPQKARSRLKKARPKPRSR